MASTLVLGPYVATKDLTDDHKVALAHLLETLEAIQSEAKATGAPLFTWANFSRLIQSAEGTPYRLGGIDPFHGGADCSGLIFWACNQLGFDCPRTTSAEWAGLAHVRSTTPNAAPIGSLCEFEVDADGGPIPQHVGVVFAEGVMIDDPFTGAVVRQEDIPNTAAVKFYGWCLLPFVVPAPSPTPAPDPGGHKMLMDHSPDGGGYWEVDPSTGAIFTYGNGVYLGGLNNAGPGGTTALIPGDTITDFTAHPTKNGYWMVTAEKHLYCFGACQYFGSASTPQAPTVGEDEVAFLHIMPDHSKAEWLVSTKPAA